MAHSRGQARKDMRVSQHPIPKRPQRSQEGVIASKQSHAAADSAHKLVIAVEVESSDS